MTFTQHRYPELSPIIAVDPEAVRYIKGRPFIVTQKIVDGEPTLRVLILNTQGLTEKDLLEVKDVASQGLYNAGFGPHYRAIQTKFMGDGTARVIFE